MEARDYDPAFSCIMELLSRVEALEAAQQPAAPAPTGDNDLVRRVASAIFHSSSVYGWENEARAAIREIAQAALQMAPDANLTWERVALWLEREAFQP